RLGEIATRLDVIAGCDFAASANLHEGFRLIPLRCRFDPFGVVLKSLCAADDRADRLLRSHGGRQHCVTDVGGEAAQRCECIVYLTSNFGIEAVEEELSWHAEAKCGRRTTERGSVNPDVPSHAVRVGGVVPGDRLQYYGYVLDSACNGSNVIARP